MSHAFADIAFTPSVRLAQERDASPWSAHRSSSFAPPDSQPLGEREADFISAQRSFYISTVSETGWPYVQHRGGSPGFLNVIDDHTLAFADFAGNRQLISVGNVSINDRVALILIDYGRRVRLKILGHMKVRDLKPGEEISERLLAPGYRAQPQRAMTIEVVAYDWNCPQHIPRRFEAEEVKTLLAGRDARIADLERRLAAARRPDGE